MNKIQIFSVSLITATLIFSGCGSSDDSSSDQSTVSTETGTFVDAPVQGLFYQTATQSGFTDANGTFKYVTGETVEFKLGNLSLGKSTASDFITPYTISDNNDTATNIALLLQNFDGNRSNSNTLDLSKLKDYNFTTSDFNLNADPRTVQASIETIFADNNFAQYRDDTNNSVLSQSDVKTNMDNYIDNNSIQYTKEFTQAYLDTHDFYDYDATYGQQRIRFRDNQKQIVGDDSSTGFEATFDDPSTFYSVPFKLENGNIIFFLETGTSVSINIITVSENNLEVLYTIITSTNPEYPVGSFTNKTWYTDKQAALNNISK